MPRRDRPERRGAVNGFPAHAGSAYRGTPRSPVRGRMGRASGIHEARPEGTGSGHQDGHSEPRRLANAGGGARGVKSRIQGMARKRRSKRVFPEVTWEAIGTLARLVSIHPGESPTARSDRLAKAVLQKFFGADWLERHVS